MTRSVRWGIDLGTTNSALAIFMGDRRRLVKNSLLDPVTPSAVAFERDGHGQTVGIVGKRAKQKLVGSRPHRVVHEFKRYMGMPDWRFRVPELDVEESAPELSARVLRDLRTSLGLRGDLPAMHAAIITVPAAFNDAAKDDTATAGALADLAWCKTLPEPVAAALAFGQGTDTSHDPIWLVYDLGGGTFDAALVRCEDGIFTILDHEGDRNLGGKDLDEAIVRELVVPEFPSELRDRALDRLGSFWPALKFQAEEAKCALSGSIESVELDHGIDGAPEIRIRRADLEILQARTFARTLPLCLELLHRNHLSASDVEKVLMVGGPSRSSSFRKFVADGFSFTDQPDVAGLGIPLDCSIDPMTAVAEGAAVYAAAQRIPHDVVIGGLEGGPDSSLVSVRIEVDAQVPDETVFAVGQLVESGAALTIRPDWKVLFERVDSDGAVGFQTDPVSVGDSASFVGDLKLLPGLNTFRVRVLDQSEQPAPVAPTTFEVIRDSGFGELTRTNGLGVADDHGMTQWLVKKGEPRDLTRTKSFETTVVLTKGESGSALSIPIVQGNQHKASLNELVYDLRVRSEDVPVTIPAGAQVRVTVSFDGRVNLVSAELPDYPDVRIEGKLNYHSRPPEETREVLERIQRNLPLFAEVRGESAEVAKLLSRIDGQRLVEEIEELLDLGSEELPDEWAQAADRARELAILLDPHYEEIDRIHASRAQLERCAENVRIGRSIVDEVYGHSEEWLAAWHDLLAEYEAAAAAGDAERATQVAFTALPDHFRASPVLRDRIRDGDISSLDAARTDRGRDRSGDVKLQSR